MASIELSRYEAEKGELPDVCVQCGEPAVCKRSKLFAWWPAWLYLLIFCYVIPMFFAAAFLGRFMKVKLPFCAQHKGAWFRRSLLFWCGLSAVAVLGLALIASGDAQVGGNNANVALWSLDGVMLIVWLVALAIFGRSVVSAKMVKRKTITLRRVSPVFIDALHEFRVLHPDLAFENAIESLVPRLVASGIVVGCALLLICLPLTFSLMEANSKATSGATPATESTNRPAAVLTRDAIHNQQHHFRLELPAGDGWRLIGRAGMIQKGVTGWAGAEHTDGRLGLVLVDEVQQPLQIAGREQEVVAVMAANSKLTDQSAPVIEPLAAEGLAGVRYRLTGANANGTSMRLENTVFERDGKRYQVFIVGLASNTRADGSSFRAFTDAFHLEPVVGEGRR